MNDNETTDASSSNGSARTFKLTLKQHLEIEYVESANAEERRGAPTCEEFENLNALLKRLHEIGAFDMYQRASFDEDACSSSPSNEVGADPVKIASVRREASEQHPRKSANYWRLPGTDCLVRLCASPDGLGALEPSNTATAYAVARDIHMLRMLLHWMRPKGEPVTLKAVDIPSAAQHRAAR